jgi:type I restriction enzyme S subunit
MWPTKAAAELQREGVLLVEDGNHGEYRPRPTEFDQTGTAFIRAGDLKKTVDFAGASKINDVALKRIRKGIGQPLDVLLTHKGTVGRVALAPLASPAFVCSPQTTFWRSLDHSILYPRFLQFALESPDFQRQLGEVQGNTDMAPYVSLTDQRRISIPLPTLVEQIAIAAVLGALDDKIAANSILAQTSDEIATTLFAQAAAGLPRALPYEDFATIGGGGTPSTKRAEYWGGNVRWATPTDVTALSAPYLSSTARTITPGGLENCASPLYPAGSILMTSRATIGAFAFAELPMAVNQGFIVVNSREPDLTMWLFHEMRSRVPDYVAMANGATFLELSRGRFKSMLMTVGTADAMAQFGERVRPLHAAARHAIGENLTLGELRDTLLPGLMSGRLRVKDVERQVEDAV